MNAPLSKEQLARLAVGNLAYHGEYVEGLSAPVEAPVRAARPASWLGRLAVRIRARWERQALLNELSEMSDRNLADIGLSRTQLSRVFDADFARARREGLSF